MNNREQFEAFLVSEYAWANDALNAADFHGDDATGYYTGGDYIYDGQSCSEGLFWAWRGWQAASKASEQQLAAVVAENAGLKGFGKTLSEMHEGLNGSGTGIQGEYEATCQQVALDAAMDAFDEIKTPETDAYLAEVRAQGVDMFALMFAEEAIKSNNITTGWRAKASREASEYAEALREDAAQLRKGAAL